MIVGNPISSRVMLWAENAYRRHGLSVQGTLPAFRSFLCYNALVKDVFWCEGLVRCGVDKNGAYRMVQDLSRAVRGGV